MGGKTWKKFMAKLYGFGAAIVIVGAMFKINHWKGATTMLVVGLSTEAVIFFFSAFEPPHEEVDWSLVYPELAGMHGEEGAEGQEQIEEEKGTITEQLDNMLEDAKIGPELIASLGDGMRNLSDQASKLTNITDATMATNEYVGSVRTAAKNVGTLSETYSKAAESLTGLAALNASYELQLQGSNDHLKATTKFYEGIGDLMKNLNDSVSDTKRYKDQISQLSTNLESLNTIYGNMLTAMRK